MKADVLVHAPARTVWSIHRIVLLVLAVVNVAATTSTLPSYMLPALQWGGYVLFAALSTVTIALRHELVPRWRALLGSYVLAGIVTMLALGAFGYYVR